jgi:hypothetical protein
VVRLVTSAVRTGQRRFLRGNQAFSLVNMDCAWLERSRLKTDRGVWMMGSMVCGDAADGVCEAIDVTGGVVDGE